MLAWITHMRNNARIFALVHYLRYQRGNGTRGHVYVCLYVYVRLCTCMLEHICARVQVRTCVYMVCICKVLRPINVRGVEPY